MKTSKLFQQVAVWMASLNYCAVVLIVAASFGYAVYQIITAIKEMNG